jgi:hypothetical protein
MTQIKKKGNITFDTRIQLVFDFFFLHGQLDFQSFIMWHCRQELVQAAAGIGCKLLENVEKNRQLVVYNGRSEVSEQAVDRGVPVCLVFKAAAPTLLVLFPYFFKPAVLFQKLFELSLIVDLVSVL